MRAIEPSWKRWPCSPVRVRPKRVAVVSFAALFYALEATTAFAVPIAIDSPVPAAQKAGAPRPPGQRVPLSLIVDGVPKGNVIALVRASDVLLIESDLQMAGVRLRTGSGVGIGGVSYASLASLAPLVTYKVDLDAFTLALTVDPTMLPRTVVSLGDGTPKFGAATGEPSGFVSYSVASDSANLGGNASGFVQMGVGSASAGVFTATASYANAHLQRGLLAFRREDETHLKGLTIGDQAASTGSLGGNVVLGGVGIRRHFEYQPDEAYFPTPGINGTVLSPTTADLYVNGTLLRTVRLQPGAFALSGIPVAPGPGVTQVVLRDASGNTQTIGGAYYQSRALLRKGLIDYDYDIGFTRAQPFGKHDTYGPLVALGTYRIGLTDAVTVGARFERTVATTSAGPRLDFVLPIGHVSLESSLSSALGMAGNAFAAAYEYAGSRFAFGASAITQSANYATVSLSPRGPRLRSSIRVSVGLPLSRSYALSISDTTSTSSNAPVASAFALAMNVRAARQAVDYTFRAERESGGSLFGIAGVTRKPSWTLGVQTSLLIGRRANLSTDTTSAGGQRATTVALSQSPPGLGLGYQLQATGGSSRTASAAATYETQFGDIAAALSTAGYGTQQTTIALSGGLVAFGRGLFFTRPVSGGYALVDVPGFKHVPVFSESQFAGRTDGRGAMVVPQLEPYNQNEIGIGQMQSHIDLLEQQPTTFARPKTLSGSVATFAVRRIRAYTGRFVVQRGSHDVVPSLGTVVFSRDGKAYPSDLGSTGQFYVENLAPGSYSATVTDIGGAACTLQINLPAGSGPVTSIGAQACLPP